MLPEHERARLSKRLADIAEKVENGFLPFFKVMDALRMISEGKLLDSNSWTNGKILPMMVNYNFPIRDILMSGGYYRVASTIDFESFQPPPIGGQSLKVRLYSFGRELESAEAVDSILNSGYRFVTLFELLCLGVQHHQEQLVSRIVTFHMLEDYPEDAFLLNGHYRKRSVGHFRAIRFTKWSRDTRFAIVKNEIQTF